ncbi:MAG: hypothetical protein ACRDB0_07785 [Paraclostridium sp.]
MNKIYIVNFIKVFPDELMKRWCEPFFKEEDAFKLFDKIKKDYIDNYLKNIKDDFINDKSIHEFGGISDAPGYWHFVSIDGQEEIRIELEKKEVK